MSTCFLENHFKFLMKITTRPYFHFFSLQRAKCAQYRIPPFFSFLTPGVDFSSKKLEKTFFSIAIQTDIQKIESTFIV